MDLTLQEWGIIATICSTIITLILIVFNFLTLREMKTARIESSRPFIVVGFELDSNERFIYLFVENIGKTPAININVKIDKPIILKNNTDARHILFDKPIKYLSSNQKIKTLVFPVWEVPDKNGKFAANSVEISYYDCANKNEYTDKYDIDVRSFIETLYFENKNISHLVNEFEKLNKNIEKISSI